MRHHFLVIAAVLATSLLSAAAEAGVQRSFVSMAHGDDANIASSCQATAPCRFFQAATSVLNDGGEVVVLDSGGYGAVTLTQSTSLIAPAGVYGGITVFSDGTGAATGVTIATPGVKVTLKGLTINGMGGVNGVLVTNGANLTVEGCAFSNLQYAGQVSGVANVIVNDSTFQDNTFGIYLVNGATATIANSQFYDNFYSAAYAYGNAANTVTTLTVDNSVVKGGGIGFFAESHGTLTTTYLNVSNSVVVGTSNTGMGVNTDSSAASSSLGSVANSLISNTVAHTPGGTNLGGLLSAGLGANLVINNNTVTNNTIGLNVLSGAVMLSAGDNTLYGNATPVSGTLSLGLTGLSKVNW